MSGKKLSVIIVAHNALPYLDLTIRSVLNATREISSEIILVDNASQEAVSDWVIDQFPSVHLISSPENLGFGKANNLALERANGEIILYLNPDTVISKDSIDEVIAYFESHSEVGAIGLRMINGKGEFLPESKRSVPGLWSSFCRVTGLSNAYPGSRIFSSYRLGYVPEDSISEVEVLSGACMFIRVQQQKLKTFDPDFFMYGEDIDLSYRIAGSGYKVIYFGKATIVHFKGESTNKRLWSYHYWFYNTMWLFRKKHFSRFPNGILNALIFPGIWTLMVLAFLKEQIKSTGPKPQFGFSSFHVLGTLSNKLKLSLQKFSHDAKATDFSDAELIIINVRETPPEMIISSLQDKLDNQKLIFWSEDLERFFGSY